MNCTENEAPGAWSLMRSFYALWRADLTALLRNRRALMMTFALPVFLLLLADEMAGRRAGAGPQAMPLIAAFVLNSGMFALGLFSFANDLAVARERGTFRRLRCAPVPSWFLLASLLLVQVPAMLAQTLLILGLSLHDGLRLGLTTLLLTLAATTVSGLMALAFGQLVAALVRTAAGVNATARLLFFGLVFLLEGSYGGTRPWPEWLRALCRWSPVQLSQFLFSDILATHRLGVAQAGHLVAILAYTALMALVGLRAFQWQAQ